MALNDEQPDSVQGYLNQANAAYAPPTLESMSGMNQLVLRKPAPAPMPPPQQPAGLDSYLSQMPVVTPTGSEGLLGRNNAMDRADMASYDKQAKEALASQGAGLDSLQQYIKQMQGKSQGINWTPLAAYVDSLGPNSHLADAAKSMAPMTPEEHDKMMFELQSKLQGGRAAMSKDQLEALGQRIKMQHDNRRDDLMSQRLTGVLDSREKMAAERQYQNDKLLNAYIPRADGAVKILNLLDAGERGEFKTNKAFFNQAQAELARLETGSQTVALGAQEQTHIDDLRANFSALKDAVSGGVSDVDLSKKIQQMRAMVQDLAKSTNDQIEARHAGLIAGATPSQVPVFSAKIGVYRDSYSRRMGATSQKDAPPTHPDDMTPDQIRAAWRKL